MQKIISNHKKIALQLSGGKDSLACLYIMRPYWDRLTVYWLNTGAAFPETVEQMKAIREMVPHFVEIGGRQPEVIEEFGLPSDIVPVNSTPVGVTAAGDGRALIQDRYSCCLRSLMIPMHERMMQDGVTLIIRGQKDSDRLKAPIKSGDVVDGIQYLLPIETWDDDDVLSYLKGQGATLPRFYETLRASPDCISCSAYWEEGRAAYLKQHHPREHVIYLARLDAINVAVNEHIAAFNHEVNA
ncbi:phosphoadenosine phosphosulfate reductase [Ralstonia phage Heva]|uniref:Phosphoadenosine phosphosulfate reductase n=4 Tax=Cimandefvirus TaxID=2843366 RepID=A0A7G5BAP6_9CAUD|nr:phosphoadenosine phosphosulfate reductase [Ralstonia phage Cimandef]YP_010078315.1 phosphoadenosine phosphosulfate reductase [Ralstonia phage Eline]YP_010078369.1 phosphoadenosine phosphosulfate reductase [Ralstonia phage Gamede]YP_010078476.1 phosphoadenosine phosphosulfate reductase [Ralstonia phage Heva]QMV32873.1 phosphoadenosine phosphosulfate reductase [Ralstonia phage Dimitile]QMV32699.1 phosphoadenosine phosphosulfate reductase [Ralstonia phage Cimandef]QMV33054.1 phosphoadenosine 